MIDTGFLTQVVVSLEYHGEDEQAAKLREHLDKRDHIRYKILYAIRASLIWLILVGSTVSVVAGFVLSVLDKDFFGSLLILVLGTIVYCFVAIMHGAAKKTSESMVEEEIER